MLNADGVGLAVADHLDMLVELVAIGVELEALAQLDRQYDASHQQAAIDDVRRRQQRVCVAILERLRALICAGDVETIH